MQQTRTSAQSDAHGDKGATFEQQFVRLQEVVQKLSNGNLALSEALASFEEGMLLADNCGKMLEEAELRVEQVSERAVRAGSTSLAELDEAMRSANTDEAELVSIEVESYESTFVFDTLIQSPAETGKTNGRAPEASKGRPPVLDPLFDEED